MYLNKGWKMKILSIFLLFFFVSLAVLEPAPKSVNIEVPLKPFNKNAVQINKPKRGSRILNSPTADDSQFPFVNEINFFINDNSYTMCTGSFLTPSWTITAYHCINRYVLIKILNKNLNFTFYQHWLRLASNLRSFWLCKSFCFIP